MFCERQLSRRYTRRKATPLRHCRAANPRASRIVDLLGHLRASFRAGGADNRQ